MGHGNTGTHVRTSRPASALAAYEQPFASSLGRPFDGRCSSCGGHCVTATPQLTCSLGFILGGGLTSFAFHLAYNRCPGPFATAGATLRGLHDEHYLC